jgi:hypothetical protein
MQGGFVRRLLLLASFALVASLFLAPTAGAQEMMQEKMMDESMMMEQPKMMDDSMMMEKGKMMEEPKMMEKKGKMEMPKTGGPATLSMLLPAVAVLLLGSGVLTYAVLRRR